MFINSKILLLKLSLSNHITCLSVCLCPINVKSAEHWDQILCVTSRDPREGLWTVKISKLPPTKSVYIKF